MRCQVYRNPEGNFQHTRVNVLLAWMLQSYSQDFYKNCDIHSHGNTEWHISSALLLYICMFRLFTMVNFATFGDMPAEYYCKIFNHFTRLNDCGTQSVAQGFTLLYRTIIILYSVQNRICESTVP